MRTNGETDNDENFARMLIDGGVVIAWLSKRQINIQILENIKVGR